MDAEPINEAVHNKNGEIIGFRAFGVTTFSHPEPFQPNDIVKVIAGRKIPKGTIGKIIWIKMSKFGQDFYRRNWGGLDWRCFAEYYVLLEFDGKRMTTNANNLEKVKCKNEKSRK